MSFPLDVSLWTQKYHKIDPALQYEFLAMQLKHSQSTSVHDIPLMMLTLLTGQQTRAISVSGSSGSGQGGTSTGATPVNRSRIPTLTPVDNHLGSALSTAGGGSLVTPEKILDWTFTYLHGPAGGDDDAEHAAAAAPSTAESPSQQWRRRSSNSSQPQHHRSSTSVYSSSAGSTATAVSGSAACPPTGVGADIIFSIVQGWSVDAHNAEHKRAVTDSAVSTLVATCANIVCAIDGVLPDYELCDISPQSVNLYETEKPSVRSTVLWLATRLLRSVLSLDVLERRSQGHLVDLMDGDGRAVTPFASIMNVLWSASQQRRTAPLTAYFPRDVVDTCRQGAFSPLLSWEAKDAFVTSCCAHFSFTLYCMITNHKYQLLRLMPPSLMAARFFCKRRVEQSTGLLVELLRMKSVYENSEESNSSVQLEPSDFVRMLVFHLHRLTKAHLPHVHEVLYLWSSGPLAATIGPCSGDTSSSDSVEDPQENLLLTGVRSWFETIFCSSIPHNSQHTQPESPKRAPERAPVTSMLDAKGQVMVSLLGELMGPESVSIVWRNFVAFGWPFTIKLALQLLHEGFSSTGPSVPGLLDAEGKLQRLLLAVKSTGHPSRTRGGASSSTHQDASSPLPLLHPYMDGPPDSYRDIKDLRMHQKEFLLAINQLPASVVDMDSLVRRSDQWDKVLLEHMRSSSAHHPLTAEYLTRWEQQFASVDFAKKKVKSILSEAPDEDDIVPGVYPRLSNKFP